MSRYVSYRARSRRLHAFKCAGAVALAIITSPITLSTVRADTYTWTAATGSSNWDGTNGTDTNWSPNSLPPSTADIQFTIITAATNVNLQIARTVNSVTLGTLQHYTLTGGSLAITSGKVNVNSTVEPTNQTLDTPVTLGAPGSFTIESPATLTVTQPITDGTNPYGLDVNGGGVLDVQSAGNSLSTLSTHGAILDINGGAINVRNSGPGGYGTSFYAPVTIENGGTLTMGDLQINGGSANTLTVSGSGSEISGKTLDVGTNGTSANFHVTGGGKISTFSLDIGLLDNDQASVATIDTGSTVTSFEASVGGFSGGTGAATVTDPNSVWQTLDMVFGGVYGSLSGGTGMLTVANSGKVQATGDTIFHNSASSLVIDKGTYVTAQLDNTAGTAPIIKITDPTGATALTLTNNDLSTTPNFSGTIVDGPNGPGSVVKTGSAIQILSGHNTYTGGTTISGGTLRLGVADALSSTSPVTVNSASTLDIGAYAEHIGNLTLNGGTVTGVTGAALFGNNFTLESGTISVPLFAAIKFNKATTGAVTDTALIVANGVAVNQGVFDAQAGIQATVGVGLNAQLKARGTITGDVSGNFNSTITATGGLVIVGNTAIDGTLDVNSQSVSFSSGFTTQVANTSLSGGILSAPDGYKISGGLSGFGSVIASISNTSGPSNSIVCSGALSLGTFAASDSLSGYSGSLYAGTNQLNLFSSGFTSLGSSATLAGGSINSINGVRVKSGTSLSGFGTVTGPLDNQGTVTGGAGVDVLHLTGPVTGAGSFEQNISIESSLSPGDGIATVSFSGNTVFAPTSLLKMELSGLGQSHDHITDTGSLALGGTLDVSLIGGFIPAAGQSFDLLDFDPAHTTGTFATVQLPALTAGLFWNTSRLYIDGTISISPVPGDYNGNGIVDAADYVAFRNTLGQTGTALPADGNGNGTIDAVDYDIWRANFNNPRLASGSLAGAAVPEPASFLLLTIVLIAGSISRACMCHRCR